MKLHVVVKKYSDTLSEMREEVSYKRLKTV